MQKKQTKQNEEIAKIIERDQIISYKKKTSNKQQPKQSDDEIQSANSLKSGVFSQDSEAKGSKKNTPLPELYRDKKRIFHKNFVIGEGKQVNNYLEKEVRQHDNLVLKQKNNLLSTENMKLKTKVMALEKELSKISRNIEDDSQKPKQPGLLPKDNKFKGSQALSLKMAIKNLRKELDEQKKENEKIKWSVKFTRINELEIEREEILNETARLRQMLQEEQLKRASLKTKEQGLSGVQQKLQSLTDKNIALSRQNAELNKKLKAMEEGKKVKQISENEKNLSKMLFNAKRLIKQKQKQIETLKVQSTATQPKIESIASINMDPKSSKQVSRPAEINKSKQKRIMSKSAQKYRKRVSDETNSGNECENCNKYKEKIELLEKKLEELTLKLKAEKENNAKFGAMGEFSREEIDLPKVQEVEKLGRFLTFRFKAHHLSLEEAQKYLINGELTEATKKQSISVLQMAESLVAQPFSVLSSRYLEICLLKLFYPKQCQKQGQKSSKIKIDENKKLTKGQILANFSKFIQKYEIMAQEKQEQMFIQIAELVTNYHQHILTALNRKRNGEGTISEAELVNFFNEIELEKEFVDFIICQIILESLDLEHLNYYTMFEIFYMPTQGQITTNEPNQPNKKKFQVDHSQVVKQEDQEYEESKSHIDTRQKTQSKKDQELEEYEEEEHDQNSPSQHSEKQKVQEEDVSEVKVEARQKRNMSLKNVEAKLEKEKDKGKEKEKEKEKQKQKEKGKPKEQEEEDYEQLFQQQKMDQLPQEEKANEGKEQQQELKPYMMEQVYDEYKQEGN